MQQALQLKFPNLIIGGTNKAGTTSVYRYLQAHPQTCASSVKEPRFFSHHPDPLADEALQEYAGYFRGCRNDCQIRFEASPQYLAGGAIVATRISKIIPHVRLVFILRDPADRLMSFYHSYAARDSSLVRHLTAGAFIESALKLKGIDKGELPPPDAQLQRELYRGRYHPLLVEYLSVFGADQILILFFEELVANPRVVMQKLCDFAGIDKDFYRNFTFTVENKSRQYRSARLNQAVHHINMRLEPALARLPWLRHTMRRAYTALNEHKQKPRSHAQDLSRLSEYYRPYCRDLGKLVREQWPATELPKWAGDAQ